MAIVLLPWVTASFLLSKLLFSPLLLFSSLQSLAAYTVGRAVGRAVAQSDPIGVGRTPTENRIPITKSTLKTNEF